MTKRLPSLLLCLLLAFAPVAAMAQSSAQRGAQAALEAMRAEGLPALAAHMHPQELARFRSLVLPALAPPADAPVALQRNAAMLRASVFGPQVTAAALTQMSPASLLGGFLAANQQQMQQGGMGFGSFQVLGEVAEGDTVHVLARSQTLVGPQRTPFDSLEVLSLRRDGTQWKLLLSSELEGMARSLSSQAASPGPG